MPRVTAKLHPAVHKYFQTIGKKGGRGGRNIPKTSERVCKIAGIVLRELKAKRFKNAALWLQNLPPHTIYCGVVSEPPRACHCAPGRAHRAARRAGL